MNDTRSLFISALFALVPYLLMSWGYMVFVNGDSSQFWRAFGVLLAVRFFFSVIDALGNVIVWRLYGKKRMTNYMLEFMHANSFPKRENANYDHLDYLTSIIDGPQYSDATRTTAKEIHSFLLIVENTGILLQLRIHSAMEAALDIYSPKSETTQGGK